MKKFFKFLKQNPPQIWLRVCLKKLLFSNGCVRALIFCLNYISLTPWACPVASGSHTGRQALGHNELKNNSSQDKRKDWSDWHDHWYAKERKDISLTKIRQVIFPLNDKEDVSVSSSYLLFKIFYNDFEYKNTKTPSM